MNLKDWWNANPSEKLRQALAKKCGTSRNYLSQAIYNKDKKAGPSLCKKLHDASKAITPKTIIVPADERPDLAAIFSREEEASQ